MPVTIPAVSVVVPWRPDGTQRRTTAWAYLSRRWATTYPTWELVEGTCPPGPWSKGGAVTDAVARAGGDLLVVADADVWCDDLLPAVHAVAGGAPWAVPHLKVHRLDFAATLRYQTGTVGRITCVQSPYRGHAGGGLTVLPRDLYRRVPLDPRFAGWGQEDDAWGLALAALAGPPWRGQAPLWHLWHAPQQRLSRRTGSDANRRLYDRYQIAAQAGPGPVEALLAEIGRGEP